MRLVHVDPADRSVRMRAAHEGRVQHAGKRDVVDEAALADEQGAVLQPRNARSDQSTHVLDRVSRFAARAFVRLHRVNVAQSDIALAALAMTSLGVA